MAKELALDLDKRLAALEESSQQGADFDGLSWFWLLLFGIVVPLALLVWGWSA